MKSCQKACSLGSSLSSRESALEHLHNPQYKISISSSASFPLYILQNRCFGPSHVMHPKSPIQDSTFCRLVLPLKWSAYSLPFPAFVYLLTSVSFHSFIFLQGFFAKLLISELFSLLNCSLLTSIPTKALDSLWSACFVKANFNIKHICILNPQTESLWSNCIDYNGISASFFKMHFPHNV